jgi:phosphopantetheinyl transferase
VPLYRLKNITDKIQLGIWFIDESISDLTSLASNLNIDISNLPEVKNDSRIKQWLATRLISAEFSPSKIRYNTYGKPVLENGWNISISHSGKFVAVIINKVAECGIDVEKLDSKVDRIKHKFLNKSDIDRIISIQDLTIYWGAKEALYKCYGKKEVLFIENLFVEEFSPDSAEFIGLIDMPDLKTKFKMTWEKIEDYVLVYTL